MAGAGQLFEYVSSDGTRGRCWAEYEAPREGDRSVILSEDALSMKDFPQQHPALHQVQRGSLHPIFALVAWQYRQQFFNGGEPEVWYEHVLDEAGRHTYYRIIFTQSWRTGSYGEAIRTAISPSEVPRLHRFFVEGWPKQP